jgi:hypothetical protein
MRHTGLLGRLREVASWEEKGSAQWLGPAGPD